MSRTTQKIKCKAYEGAKTSERNKARNKARAERQEVKAIGKISLRIGRKKPVPSKHLARESGTSRGKMANGAHLAKAAA